MSNYLTTFNNLTEYNAFLDSNDCPPINVSYITSTSEVKYYKDTPSITPFTIEIDTLPDGVSEIYPKFYLQKSDTNYPKGDKVIFVKYKINDGNWVEYPETWNNYPGDPINWQRVVVNIPIALSEGDKISFISNNMHLSCQLKGDNWFLDQTTNGLLVNISGNIMSLAYGDNYAYATPDYYEGSKLYFTQMFKESTFLKDASDLILPSHNLPDSKTSSDGGVFQEMFYGCPNLVAAPNIYAKELPHLACRYMYRSCPSLTDIGVIYTKKINDHTFDWMYSYCTSITSIDFSNFLPNLENISGEWPFGATFRSCTGLQSISGLGELISNITYANNVKYAFGEMFQECTSLDITDDSEVFDISTSINSMDLFYWMFYHCTSLTHTPVMNYVSATTNMFGNCGSITHMYWLGTTWNNSSWGNKWNANEGTLYYNSTASLEYNPAASAPSGWQATAYTPSNG